tara:strand:- start:975 stop:1451 length:477 start_codon:yes stop_codon:yes gene_type:complete
MKAKKQIEYRTETRNGILYMECKCCGQMTAVSPDTSAVTCHECVRENFEKDFPFTPKIGYVSTGRPRGWAFMKEYVDKDGNVYHKGKEQPQLKGKLKPTVIKSKPAKKRLSKKEKQRISADALASIHKLKKQLGKAKFKKDIKRINSEIKKLQKLIKY